MPKLTLTDFLDVVTKSGAPKATKIAQIKHRPNYSPQTDFYKRLREVIIETHKSGNTKASLASVLSSLDDAKKQANYPPLVAGYLKWWGKRPIAWFDPPSGQFKAHGFSVNVAPELGVLVNGTPHLIKLYFKKDPLSKSRTDIITFLMSSLLQANSPGGCVMSVLDIRNSKLIAASTNNQPLGAMLHAELAYIAALWPNV